MKITILTTGGTIDKTYNEFDGSLRNDRTVLEEILSTLRLPDLFIRHIQVLHKDSLEITREEREKIVAAVQTAMPESEGILVIHGTDTLETTGELIHSEIPNPSIPVILTGAMRPYEFRDSDAQQNVTEALLSVRLLTPGIYAVMHNRILRFPGVKKDRENLSFTDNS